MRSILWLYFVLCSWNMGLSIFVLLKKYRTNFVEIFWNFQASTANIFIRGECGRWPLYIDYFCKCIKYWVRLTRMNTYRYPYQWCRMLKNLDEVGRVTWATKVRELLHLYGFFIGYIWFYENVGDEALFLKNFKQQLIDCSVQDWSSKIIDSGKARHYWYIMPNFGLAGYIK